MVAKSFIFGGNTGETPETLKRKRAMAEALSQGRMPKNVGEGLTEVGNAIAYRMALADLASGEAMGQQKASAAMSPILSAFGGGAAAFPPAPAPAGGSSAAAPMASEITSPNPAVAAMLKGEQVQGTAGNARAVDRASMAGYSGDVVQNVPNSTGAIVAKKLQSDFNLTPEAAAGFAGNLAHESGNFNTLQEINPTVKGSRGGYGWAQWTGPRRREFESWAAQNNLDPSSPEANYGFLKTELQGNEGAVLKALQGVSDPAQAAQIVSNQFLRPGVPHMDSRISRTKAILEAMNSGGQTQIASAPNAYAPEMMAAAQPQQQNVQVASLDPSIGMPQQMYVGQVNPNGSIGTAVQDAPAQGAIRKAIGGMAGEQAPQPQQMAQNIPPMPQNEPTSLDRIVGTDTPLGPPQQQPQLNVGMIMQALQEPFLNEGQRSMLNGLLQQEMQKQDPAYQLQQQQAQIGLQKDQLELQQMQQPKPQARVLNEAEKRQLGLPVTGAFQMKADGTVDQIGGGGVTVNNEGSIPAGYQAKRDAEGRIIAIEPIPGSPAAADAAASQNKQAMARSGKETAATVVTDDIDRIFQTMDNATLPTTGFVGNMLSGVGGTAARDVAGLTSTIKANASFDKLQQMRESSPTGGALGAVSDTEMGLLSAAIGNLEQSQSDGQFRDNLARVQNIYMDIIHGPNGGPERRKLSYVEDKPKPNLKSKYGLE